MTTSHNRVLDADRDLADREPPATNGYCPVFEDGPDVRAVDSALPGYAEFLRLPDLLALQPDTGTTDELLFVVIHQSQELWFKLLVRELERLRDFLLAHRLEDGRRSADRLTMVARLLTAHWSVLDTMRPKDFLAFRHRLRGGSGFESVQYREIEFLSGIKTPSYLDQAGVSGTARARLQELLDTPSVGEAFADATRSAGFASLTELYDAWSTDAAAPLLDIAERLIDFDVAFIHWRFAHSVSVERQIGHKPGTAGSSGTSYLRARTELRMFPDLWQARGEL